MVPFITLTPASYASGIVVEEFLKSLEVLAHVGGKLVFANATCPAWIVFLWSRAARRRVHAICIDVQTAAGLLCAAQRELFLRIPSMRFLFKYTGPVWTLRDLAMQTKLLKGALATVWQGSESAYFTTRLLQRTRRKSP